MNRFRNGPKILLVIGWALSPQSAAAEMPETSTLPPLEELLGESAAECERVKRRSAEESTWPLMLLVQAHIYSGDYPKALELAQTAEGHFEGSVLALCIGQQAKLTGVAPEIPKGIQADAAHMSYIELAKALALHGQFEHALHWASQIPVSPQNSFLAAEAYFEIAQQQAHQSANESGRKAARSALKAIKMIPSERMQLQHMLPLIELLVQIGNRESALAAARNAETAALQYIRAEGIPKHSAIMWAQLGKAYALLGDAAASQTAFDRAVEFAAVASESDEYTRGDARLQDRSEAFAEIAALQRSVGRAAEADRSVRRAIRLAQRLKDAGQRPYELSNISQTQLKAGHYDTALTVAKQIEDRYYRSLCLCRLADAHRTRGESEMARRLLADSQRLADTEPSPERRMQILIHLAESQAKMGDRETAVSSYQRAEKIASATDRDAYQSIARSQIRAGLLPESWRMLNRIKGRRWRVLPLAELTLAVAQREHAKRADKHETP